MSVSNPIACHLCPPADNHRLFVRLVCQCEPLAGHTFSSLSLSVYLNRLSLYFPCRGCSCWCRRLSVGCTCAGTANGIGRNANETKSGSRPLALSTGRRRRTPLGTFQRSTSGWPLKGNNTAPSSFLAYHTHTLRHTPQPGKLDHSVTVLEEVCRVFLSTCLLACSLFRPTSSTHERRDRQFQ